MKKHDNMLVWNGFLEAQKLQVATLNRCRWKPIMEFRLKFHGDYIVAIASIISSPPSPAESLRCSCVFEPCKCLREALARRFDCF